MAKISTLYGEMDEEQLEKRTDVLDNANEHTVATEYWLKDELVHRSVHVTLKPQAGATAGAEAAKF